MLLVGITTLIFTLYIFFSIEKIDKLILFDDANYVNYSSLCSINLFSLPVFVLDFALFVCLKQYQTQFIY